MKTTLENAKEYADKTGIGILRAIIIIADKERYPPLIETTK